MKKTEKYIQRFFLILAGVIGIFFIVLMLVDTWSDEESDIIAYDAEMTEEERTQDYVDEYMPGYELTADTDETTASVSSTSKAGSGLEEGISAELWAVSLQEAYMGYADVEYDSAAKLYTIIPVNPSLIDEITAYANYGLYSDSWRSVVEDVIEQGQFTKENIGDGYSIQMLNPDDYTKALIIVTDGELQSSI